MGQYKYFVIHCMATPEGTEISKKRIEDIFFIGRGWSKVGYSEVLHLNGNKSVFVEHDGDGWISSGEITYGARGHNSTSKHVSYVGGVDSNNKPKDTRTKEQYLAMVELIREELEAHPTVKVLGHNQFKGVAKACPSFSVEDFLDEINNAEKYKKKLEDLEVDEWMIDSLVHMRPIIPEENIVRENV
jgi:N-acetylmuramoyl-L-alanine amidase